MDWEKVGQAFQGGANVLAGGLMDKYQRKQNEAEWNRKTDYTAIINERQRKALHDLQLDEINHRAFLDMKKKEFETDPELFPVWQSAQGGDEKARGILETTSEFRHYVDSGIPLTAAQVERLINPGASIPSGVRSRILAGHLKASNEETKRKTDLEGVLARTKDYENREKRENRAIAEREKAEVHADTVRLVDLKKRERADKKKDWEDANKEIQDLDNKLAERDINLRTAQGAKNQFPMIALDADIKRLRELKTVAEKRRDRLTEDLLPPATTANVVEKVALTPEDMKEIAAAKAARPDLSEEAIIRAYVAYKRKEKR
jgi:ribosomal protein L24